MFDLRYSPEVPGCLSNSKGEQLCVLSGSYYTLHGGAAHRIIWEAFNDHIPEGMFVDHINRNKLDNRIENLRLASRSQTYTTQRDLKLTDCRRVFVRQPRDLMQ